VAAVSTAAKSPFLRDLGADEVVLYDERPWAAVADYALDAAGGDALAAALGALVPGGRLVAFSSGGGTVRGHDLLTGARTVTGFQIARIHREQPARYEEWRRTLWELFGKGEVRPVAERLYALEEALEAHRAVERRANCGKVVLVP
jgi:NADPH:quinone reductase-like Zn-dependent oxidoreductase